MRAAAASPLENESQHRSTKKMHFEFPQATVLKCNFTAVVNSLQPIHLQCAQGGVYMTHLFTFYCNKKALYFPQWRP